MSQTIDCVVVDAGARYGLHPSWNDLRGLVDFHLFEMEQDEATRLTVKYRDDARIHVHPIALYSCDTTLKFRIREHKALNSIFENNSDLLISQDYFVQEFTLHEEREVEARSIDSFFQGQPVHFLKLDVEGAEYELLKGATDILQRSVLGVRSEVLFAPVYLDAPLFGDIHRFMLQQGFELLNFDYVGNGNNAGRFTMPGRFGKVISSDAVWVVSNDRLFSSKGPELMKDVVRFAIFLMNNGATDLAIDTLLRAVNQEGVSFGIVRDDPLFRALHKKVLLLFKDLLSLPQLQKADITDAYQAIFQADFPLMNTFYLHELLN